MGNANSTTVDILKCNITQPRVGNDDDLNNLLLRVGGLFDKINQDTFRDVFKKELERPSYIFIGDLSCESSR